MNSDGLSSADVPPLRALEGGVSGESAPHSTTLADQLRQWFAQAPRLLGSRYLEQSAAHGRELALEIEAIRLNHTDRSDRASQALDRFLFSARTAFEVAAGRESAQGDSPDQIWHEPALALSSNFAAQERIWSQGTLPSRDFMRGHDVLIQDTIAGLARRLSLPVPSPDGPSVATRGAPSTGAAPRQPDQQTEVPR